MVNIEESSDPAPPDIRSYHRIATHNNVFLNNENEKQPTHVRPRVAAGAANLVKSDDCTVASAASNGRVPGRVDRLLRNFDLPVVVVAGILAVLSAASRFATGPAGPSAPHPSPLANDGAYVGSTRVRGDGRATPILSVLKDAATWVVTNMSSGLGYDLVPQAPSLHKREHVEMDGRHIAEACMIPVLVLLSGFFAGLTLGYFSVDPTQLQVLAISGTPKQQEYARKIMPVRENSHLLLTTLILGNMIVNEALPVIMDGVLGGGIVAVVISTALVVIFAEIIPQSICSRHGLLIGATMAPVVRVLIWFFFPLGWPIAKLLEYMLGRHHGIIYRRSEQRELIKMHAATAEGGGDLDLDTVTMAQGALDLAQKTVRDAMTSIDDVFMLPITAKLDYETLGEVVKSGHSRIPVYQLVDVPDIDLSAQSKVDVDPAKAKQTRTRTVKKVIGSMLVKSCVLLDPEDATPLASIPINSIPTVPWNEPLTNMLNAFQDGKSHMAIVSRRSRIEADEETMSIMTNAAGGLKQRFMRKVGISRTGSNDADSDSDVELGVQKHRSIFRRKSVSTASETSGSVSLKSPTLEATEAAQLKTLVQEKAMQEKKQPKTLAGLKLSQNEQLVPADAELPSRNLEQFLDALDAPLGIITLEDVLEELIGEEIYDEYDATGNAPPSAASTFVPREAVLAARKAQLEREKAARLEAAAVPLPNTNDADLEQNPAPAAPVPKRVVPIRLPTLPNMPKFITRPRSQPGKARDAAAAATAEKRTPAAPTPLSTPPVIDLPEAAVDELAPPAMPAAAPEPVPTPLEAPLARPRHPLATPALPTATPPISRAGTPSSRRAFKSMPLGTVPAAATLPAAATAALNVAKESKAKKSKLSTTEMEDEHKDEPKDESKDESQP